MRSVIGSRRSSWPRPGWFRYVVPAVLGALVAWTPTAASAHWCDDLWASSYNVVIRPVVDTVEIPTTGTATLDIHVQNNMAYPLYNFKLRASATGYTVQLTSDTPAVAGYLMPGERLRHTLRIGRSGGDATMTIDEMSFFVDFGTGDQDRLYGGGNQGKGHVVVKKEDGAILPENLAVQPGDQALHLGAAAEADFADLHVSVGDLLNEFCAGRASWDSRGDPMTAQYCPDVYTTHCATAQATRGDTKYDWQHLWAAGELAIRHAYLTGTELQALRDRLMCAWNDANFAFKAYSALILGYISSDADTRTFLAGKASAGSYGEATVAKAALLVSGDATHRTDVVAGLASGDAYVEIVCAAALGIVDRDDAIVTSELLERARWVEPDEGDNSGDKGQPFTAAHALALVVWDRRGWAPAAADKGVVSFYGEQGTQTDTTAPRAPTGLACTRPGGATLRLQWDAVTQDETGNAEDVTLYKLYWGATGNSCPTTCQHPGEGFDYEHTARTAQLLHDPTPLTPGATYYFSVVAADATGNTSRFAAEIDCAAPVVDDPATNQAPDLATVTAAPRAGRAPLTVHFDASGVTDPDGDSFALTWELPDGSRPTTPTAQFVFTTPGTHRVVVRALDAGEPAAQAEKTIDIAIMDGGDPANPGGDGNGDGEGEGTHAKAASVGSCAAPGAVFSGGTWLVFVAFGIAARRRR